MRIVTDTNVLLSSSFWTGASFTIVEMSKQREIDLILSDAIIDEFRKVLQYKEVQEKIKDKNLEMKRTVEELISIATMVEPKEKVNIIEEDPDDNKILECAIEGKVNYIITKDNHLLKLKEFRGIKIITPEDFIVICYNK